MSRLPALRRPEYTGENRCRACTVVNVAILAVAAGTVALANPLAAASVALVGAAVIWLRGYLVPYTPRFAPKLVAHLPGDVFEHAPASDSLGDLDSAASEGEAVLESLAGAGVVVVEGEQLGLAEWFADAWDARMEALAESSDPALAEAATALGPGIESARAERAGSERFVVVSGDDSTAWLRRPVAVAEVGAAQALAETDLPADARPPAAGAVCAFLETCPVCDEPLVEGPAADCCGNAVPAPGQDPPDVLACRECGVAFATFEPADESAGSEESI